MKRYGISILEDVQYRYPRIGIPSPPHRIDRNDTSSTKRIAADESTTTVLRPKVERELLVCKSLLESADLPAADGVPSGASISAQSSEIWLLLATFPATGRIQTHTPHEIRIRTTRTTPQSPLPHSICNPTHPPRRSAHNNVRRGRAGRIRWKGGCRGCAQQRERGCLWHPG